MVGSISITPTPYSDHAMVSLLFKAFDVHLFSYGPGFWKCNVSVLNNIDFVSDFENLWEGLNSVDVQDGVWWETCKAKFKDLIILHSRNLTSDYRKTVRQLEAKLRHFYRLNYINPGEFTAIIDSLNTSLKELVRDHLAGAKIRAKVQHLNDDDQPSRFFL